MAAPSFQDLFDLGRAEWIRRRPDLDIRPGSEVDMLLAAAAAMGDRILGYAAVRFAETYKDIAQGDALTTLARDHWGIERVAATAAIGQVTFTRSTTTSARTISAGTRVATQADQDGAFQTFTTDNDLLLGVGITSGSVAATCTETGTAGNVAASTITRVLDTLAPDGFAVTNSARFVGGAPEQSDEELRAAIDEYIRTLRRATTAAVQFGAKQVPSVKNATVVEDPVTGLVTLYVADAEGRSNAAMVSAVETEIVNWRAAGACVSVTGGSLTEQAISIALAVRTGVDIPAIAARVRAAIVAAVNQRQIGATLYRALIQAAALDVDRSAIDNVTVLVPAADVVPAASEVIRTSIDLVTVA